MKNLRSIKQEAGIVSIMVAMVMMAIITMVVLTYSQVIRREQRQSLDRQLNSQAFYAAESAVNAVSKAINSGVAPASLVKTSCTAVVPAALATYASAIPNTPEANVSCFMIDNKTYNLAYSSIARDSSKTGRIKSNSATPVGMIEFSWQASAGQETFASGSSFPAFASWDNNVPAVLRVDIVRGGAGNLTLAAMDTNSKAYFLYPDAAGAGPGAYANVADSRGVIVNAQCNTANRPKFCKATITVPSALEYYVHIRPIYANADVIVTPLTAGGTDLQIVDGQVNIDVTGKAQDVLKRINVRRPPFKAAIVPDFAIDSSSSICKMLTTAPGSSSDACGPLP